MFQPCHPALNRVCLWVRKSHRRELSPTVKAVLHPQAPWHFCSKEARRRICQTREGTREHFRVEESTLWFPLFVTLVSGFPNAFPEPHGSKYTYPPSLRVKSLDLGLEGEYSPVFWFFSEGLEPDSVNERLGRHHLDILLQFWCVEMEREHSNGDLSQRDEYRPSDRKLRWG